jgi:uncharacterized membrane protein YGL010W
MSTDNKLMDMLTGYAAAHQHPFNIFVHMIGIPTIMLGVLIPLTWAGFNVAGVNVNLAHLAMLGFFGVFLVIAAAMTFFAGWIGQMPLATSGTIAAFCFFGGYAAQFVGHAVEKSMPVLVKHPLQANLAAPFFTVVELFKILGLRDELFNAVQTEIADRRQSDASTS